MEVHNIVQEAVTKTVSKKKKCKKVKWLSEEALQIAEKRRKVKGEGGQERYIHLNAVSKNSKDRQESLSDQCKEIEKNRM